MFTLDATLDAVQNSQKLAVKTLVRNEVVADAMTKYVEAQTEFTRQTMKAGTDMATVVSQEMIKSMSEISKADTSRLFENTNKVFADFQKFWTKTSV